MAEEQYQLGSVIQKKGVKWLVVRLVKSQSLFESETGETYILDENYVELRNSKREAGFAILGSTRTPFEGNKDNIKGLTPISYGGKDGEVNADRG